MKKIAVIGSGTMGNGIAHVFALYGYKVALSDVSQKSLGKAEITIIANLDRMIKKELIGTKEKEQTLANIQFFTNLENATEGAGLAVEAVSEQVEIKLPLFKQLDACCAPDTILASNTSSISISQLAAATKKPEKVVGKNFMNPVQIMKLVDRKSVV